MQEGSELCTHHRHTWHTDHQTARIYRKFSSWNSLPLVTAVHSSYTEIYQ